MGVNYVWEGIVIYFGVWLVCKVFGVYFYLVYFFF